MSIFQLFMRHPGAGRGPDINSANAGGKVRWIPAFAGMTLFLLLSLPTAWADTDSISSTVRGPNSVVPGSIGSTVRAGPPKGDPMLSTTAGVPSSALSTSDGAMTSSASKGDPMLSTTAGVPSSAITTSDTATIPDGSTVSPALCRTVTKHVPDANVAYQAGVDANGKAVAPADVPGSPQMQLPSKIQIPLTVQLTKVLNLNPNQQPFKDLGEGTEATLGVLTVEGDHVLFNGQPLSDTQQDNLAVLCMKQK